MQEVTEVASTPEHYRGDGCVTCARAMKSMTHGADDLKFVTSTMVLWWWLCAFKYVWRWPRKGGAQDVRKAIVCLGRLDDLLTDEEARRYDP